MPSQPKIDPAKLRSQISRRVDNSFPVFAPLVWHAGLVKVIIVKYILGNLKLQVSCLAMNADYNKKKSCLSECVSRDRLAKLKTEANTTKQHYSCIK